MSETTTETKPGTDRPTWVNRAIREYADYLEAEKRKDDELLRSERARLALVLADCLIDIGVKEYNPNQPGQVRAKIATEIMDACDTGRDYSMWENDHPYFDRKTVPIFVMDGVGFTLRSSTLNVGKVEYTIPSDTGPYLLLHHRTNITTPADLGSWLMRHFSEAVEAVQLEEES